jgi:hypothetical protein
VFETFAEDCPAGAGTLVEITKTADTELGLDGKLPRPVGPNSASG